MPNVLYEARKPWTCPRCFSQFQFSDRYGNAVTWGALVPAFVAAYALGARGFWLFAGAVLLWSPVMFICIVALAHLVPPPLKPYVARPPKTRAKPGRPGLPWSDLDLFHR